MSPEKKRKLRNIALLALLGLIGGTFAFQAINQQAINDRANEIRTHAPGRVHDYYNRDTGNKDVFVENYSRGTRSDSIMVRIRLSEYMETQGHRDDTPTPLVDTAVRENIDTWTTYLPEEGNITQRRGEDSSRFNRYSNLVFGHAGTAPWYMPTFNHNLEDLRSAAAGHARDYVEGDGATDIYTDGRTHPGNGRENYWTESGERSSYDNRDGRWPGVTAHQETKQHLQEERPPMSLQQWQLLPDEEKFDNFWVFDSKTGWAYWAELLEPGQATSYLLDAANMTDEVVNSVVNGSYYYAIHVDSEAISPLNMERFLEPEVEGAPVNTVLQGFLEGLKGDGNPRSHIDSDIGDFDFERMSQGAPGRIFTMAGQQFRYLENQGNGNHMIIRNQTIGAPILGVNRNAAVNDWYNNEFLPSDPVLREQWEAYVAPVASSFPATNLSWADTDRALNGVITNLEDFPIPYGDRTVVVPEGERRAFNLSVADVNHLTRTGRFFGMLDRGSNTAWWLRTPSTAVLSFWNVAAIGTWVSSPSNGGSIGVRPALIIHQ